MIIEREYRYFSGAYCPKCKRELDDEENLVCEICGNSTNCGGTINANAVLRYKLYNNIVWYKPWTYFDYGYKFDGIKVDKHE